MGYVADYIQNEYHLLFASKKWIYISVNCEDEEKIPYEDLIIQAVLFWTIWTQWTTKVIWDILMGSYCGILISLWGQLVLAIRGSFPYSDPAGIEG